VNQVRRRYGLPGVGFDLRRVYTDADYVLYPDSEALIPTCGRPQTHRYVGPLLWSPADKTPAWWRDLPEDRPIVYVTLGSSGSSRLLATVLEALGSEPVTVIAALVDAVPDRLPPNVRCADYLPGLEAAERARLVISNGGSPTAQQALAAGKPIIGLPANLDQHLNMDYVVRAGAGRSIRSEHVTAVAVRQAVRAVLADATFTHAAVRLRHSFAEYDPGAVTSQVIEEAIASSTRL
jgi:UDP:flavonoid glycosyltransferase YjiC (YdhE family)